ncbi:16S rRNA (cytidine(1402)-2'-O)-methyltransferase [Thiovibrio sp. JS02]
MTRNRKKEGCPSEEVPVRQGTLFVVATPIGNLEDITLRALRILKEVDLIAAEDTRHTRKLLSHFDIHTPLISYYKEKEATRAQEIMTELAAGKSVALVSDAGTPGISDPGSILVKSAHARGIDVVPVPGASALAAGLSICGFAGPGHIFLGFLPAKASERRRLLRSLVNEPYPIVFYESPRRIVASLADCLAALGNRGGVAGRELTKIHEEIVCGPLESMQVTFARRGEIKGEFVVLLEGGQVAPGPETGNLDELLAWYRNESGLSMKDAVQRLAGDLNLSRSEVYRKALAVWKK